MGTRRLTEYTRESHKGSNTLRVYQPDLVGQGNEVLQLIALQSRLTLRTRFPPKPVSQVDVRFWWPVIDQSKSDRSPIVQTRTAAPFSADSEHWQAIRPPAGEKHKKPAKAAKSLTIQGRVSYTFPHRYPRDSPRE